LEIVSLCFKENVVKARETEYNTNVNYAKVTRYELEVYIMKGSVSTDLGIVTISPDVIAKYAGSVAVECFGIVGMAAVSMKDGLVKLLKRESLTKGIQVDISDDNTITLDFHVIVSYGVSISAVTDNLISNVKYKVEEFADMKVEKINIFVEGVRVID